MTIILEIATINYDNDILQIKKALSYLQTTCEISEGYLLSRPVSKFGWTFFQLLLKSDFNYSSEFFFSMIQKYRGKNKEKFTNFMSDFFQARGCKIKLKLIES